MSTATAPHLQSSSPGQLSLQGVNPACLCFALRRLSRVVTQRYENRLSRLGLKPTQFTLLVTLHNANGATVNQLASDLLLDQSSLSRNLAVMKRHGWVSVRAGTDKRFRFVQLTDLGISKIQEALPEWTRAQDELGSLCGGPTLDRLHTVLNQMQEALLASTEVDRREQSA